MKNFQFQFDIHQPEENKKELVRGIRTHDLTRLSLKSYPLD